MNILMVHNFYQIGGGEHTVFANEVKLLKDNGQHVFVYTRNNNELSRSLIKKIFLPFSAVFSLTTFFEVRKLIEEKGIDIVHCHNTFPLISPSVYYAAISKDVPVIQTIHNYRFLCPNGLFYCKDHICEVCKERNDFWPAIKNRCYRNSALETSIVSIMLGIHRFFGTYKRINYIFLTDFNRKKFSRLIDISGKNIFIKPNFVNGSIGFRKNKINTKNVFVYAGRLEHSKGIDYLLEKWAILPNNYELQIFGDGSLRNEIIKFANEQHNIVYNGFCSSEAIMEELQNARALIFPSLWYEGFPMIIAESFSVGCPVISTNIGNQSDIVNMSKGGVCFDIDVKDSFYKAIEQAIELNDQLSLNAFCFFNQYLSKNENYKMILSIYESVKKR